MRTAGLVLLLATGVMTPLAAVAQPRPPEAETRYREALLAISASGDLDSAIQTYRELLADPDIENRPGLQWDLYTDLGKAWWALREHGKALEAFEACRRLESSGKIPKDKHRCDLMVRLVALEQSAVETIPTRWAFDPKTSHGFVLLSERGTMRLEGSDRSDGVLAWEQELQAQSTAEMAIGVAIDPDSPTPDGIRMRAASTKAATLLDLVVQDRLGREYQAEYVEPSDRLRTWNVSFKELTPRAPSWPDLDPRTIALIRIRAVNPSDARANHRIVLDDVAFY